LVFVMTGRCVVHAKRGKVPRGKKRKKGTAPSLRRPSGQKRGWTRWNWGCREKDEDRTMYLRPPFGDNGRGGDKVTCVLGEKWGVYVGVAQCETNKKGKNGLGLRGGQGKGPPGVTHPFTKGAQERSRDRPKAGRKKVWRKARRTP